MDLVQDLRERRGLFQTCAQMMILVGKECQGKEMEAAARKAYAAAFVMMEQMDQLDQALAAIDEGVMRPMEVEVVCAKCGVAHNLRAVMNMLVSQEDQTWDDVKCLSCGEHAAHIRRDSEKVAKAYSLTVHGVLGSEKDTRTNEERMAEAQAVVKDSPVNSDQLPPAQELRATLLGEMVNPVVIEHGNGHDETERSDIRKRLENAKAKIRSRDAQSDENDF